MGSQIEDIASKWLLDPAYAKVFKHTADVVEDYMCYMLTAIGALALSVRFISGLGTGDTNCIITGVKSINGTEKDLGPYPGGATLSMVNYAQFYEGCIDAAMSMFLQHLPFIIIVQAISIIFIEKMLLKIPKVSGRIERFYATLVEESLFGRDPDGAEDVTDDRDQEVISRKRRKNEVCNSMKRSSIIYLTYLIKNVAEILLQLIFILLNIYFVYNSQDNLTPSICIVDIMNIPDIDINEKGHLYFQCEGKKVRFFFGLMYIHIIVQAITMICSFVSIIWCARFRSISRLLQQLKRSQGSKDTDLVKDDSGQDFLFLFDLLAHTAGIESTLRVLTHADESFHDICLPVLDYQVDHVKEDKIQVVWSPAKLEYWLKDNAFRGLEIDSYDVTIHPAETVINSVIKMKNEIDGDGKYRTQFVDLQGGKTEYIITIACVIGKSRMKGAKIVTNLLPYGPEKPRGGIVKSLTTDTVEIAWEPPKGGFTKYVLCVDPSIKSYHTGYNTSRGNSIEDDNDNENNNSRKISKEYTERELSSMLTSYKISGLSPGEIYGLVLKTKTGTRYTRKHLFETAMTKPQAVSSLHMEEVTTSTATVGWLAPEAHSKLKAFNLILSSSDHKREMAVKKMPDTIVISFDLDDLEPATEYCLKVRTVCVFKHLKTMSEPREIKFRTKPEPPTNLTMDTRFPNSFTISWDPTMVAATNHRYKLSIECGEIGYAADYSIPGDKNIFNFSKLPEIVGTGAEYSVSVEYCVSPGSGDVEVCSEPVVANFLTKPLPPTNFKLGQGPMEIQWTLSPTPSVRTYKIKYKAIDDGNKPEETLVNISDEFGSTTVSYIFDSLSPESVYKVNIYSIVTEAETGDVVESRELHEKISLDSETKRLYIFDDERLSALGDHHGDNVGDFSRRMSSFGATPRSRYQSQMSHASHTHM